METLLHLLTHDDVSLAEEIIERQRGMAYCRVEVMDLREGESDYGDLLEKIFQADSVEVW